MNRLPDWHSRYVEFINDMRQTPFEWGTNDCGPSWAGAVVTVLTGEPNPAEAHIGKYSSMLGAIKYTKECGFDDLKQAVASFLGEPVHSSCGYIGDIALFPTGDSALGYSLGIVNGERVFYRMPSGIGTLDLLEADCVFKI